MTNPTGLCKCGCGKRTNLARQTATRYGHVKGQPVDYIHGHSSTTYPQGWDVVDLGYETPCWVWHGRLDRLGYGRLRDGEGDARTDVLAHRFVYKQYRGPIPERHHLDHLCEQPSCVNPDHLLPSTVAQHFQRHSKLTPEIVEEIRRATGSQREIAARFGLSQPHVSQIRRRVRWR